MQDENQPEAYDSHLKEETAISYNNIQTNHNDFNKSLTDTDGEYDKYTSDRSNQIESNTPPEVQLSPNTVNAVNNTEGEVADSIQAHQIPSPQLGHPSVVPVKPNTENNPNFQKQKKLVIIIASIIAVIVLLVIGLLFTKFGNETEQSNNNQSVVTEERSSIVAINELDNKYGSNRIKPEKMGFKNGNPDPPVLYANLEDSTSYFVKNKPSEWRYYKLDNMYNYTDIHGLKSGNFQECDKYLKNNQDKITTVINIFKDNGFSYRQPRDISERSIFDEVSKSCYQGGMYVSKDNLCSTKFSAVVKTDNDDGTSEVVSGIFVACSPREELINDVEKVKLAKQLMIDLGLPIESKIFLPNYIKESKTPGYMIAEINSGVSNDYYFKKGDHKWQKVTSPNGLTCELVKSSIDLTNAFKDEPCSNGNNISTENLLNNDTIQ